MLLFNPICDPVPELLKPFTPTLGLSIAPLKATYYEGTGALYLRLSSTDKRTVLLIAAHVARPPTFISRSLPPGCDRPPREEIVALGYEGYNKAITSMLKEISKLARSIDSVAELVKGGETTQTRQAYLDKVDEAKKRIEKISKLHSDVTKFRTIREHRTIGFVLHAEPIAIGNEPHKFICDWALVELYDSKIDWDSFKGNKVYVGTFPIISHSIVPQL